MPFDENEVSNNAHGGTEITKRKLGEVLDQDLLKEFQIVPSRVRELDETKLRIYHAHDLPNDPECAFFKDSSIVDKFHKIIFSSHWQYQQFRNAFGLEYSPKCDVIETWIETAKLEKCRITVKPADKINIFYASTPHRGLELLVPVFEKLTEKYGDLIHLHVHSSFEIYGWKERDEMFKPMYDKIKEMKNATYYGFIPHNELIEKINDYHILAYPSIWEETSCRVLMEAMTACCFCIHPSLGALPDTSGGCNLMYQGSADFNYHASIFYQLMVDVIETFKNKELQTMLDQKLLFNKQYCDSRFNLPLIKSKWDGLMKSISDMHKDVESRKFPAAQFVYRA